MPVSSSALMPSLCHTRWVTAGSQTSADLLTLLLQPQHVHCHASSWTRTRNLGCFSWLSLWRLPVPPHQPWHQAAKPTGTSSARILPQLKHHLGKGLHSSVLSPTREMQEDFVCRTMNDVEIMLDTNQKADTILPPLGSHSNANNYWTHLPIVQGLGPVQGSITQKSWHAQTPCPRSVTQEESMAKSWHGVINPW